MEQLTQALWALAAAVVSALAGVLIPAVRQWAETQMATRLGNAAGRVAGEIAATIAADPNVQMAGEEALAAGAQTLRDRLPDAVAKLGVSEPTLRGMVAGELGKLGQAVQR